MTTYGAFVPFYRGDDWSLGKIEVKRIRNKTEEKMKRRQFRLLARVEARSKFEARQIAEKTAALGEKKGEL